MEEVFPGKNMSPLSGLAVVVMVILVSVEAVHIFKKFFSTPSTGDAYIQNVMDKMADLCR